MRYTCLQQWIFQCLILFNLFGIQLNTEVKSQTTTWKSGGPYADTDINSLAMAETDPDISYAGTSRGVFKSVNGGITWTQTSIPKTLIRVVQVTPDNHDIVYAGTDDGIYKSEDGGSTWTQKGLAGTKWVNTIAIDPLNPDILYAGTGKPLSSYGGEIVGIFKSTDGGETWQEKLSQESIFDIDAVAAILIDADNSAYIYAATYGDLRKSTDGGETWMKRNIADPYRSEDVVEIAMTPAGYNLPAIYAVIGGDDVYKSEDKGESWEATNVPHIDANSPWALAVAPNNPNVIYVGTTDHRFGSHEHLYKSTNGGDTWLLKDNGLPEYRYSSPSSILIDPRNNDVYVGIHDGGIYKSTNGAESWTILSSTTDEANIKNLAVHPNFSNTVLAPVSVGGLAKTTDGGTSWDFLPGGTSSGPVAFDPQNPSTIWAGGGTLVNKSTDNGQNWTSIKFLVCTPGPCYAEGTDILIKPDDSDCILVGTLGWDGVFVRTTDGGISWSQLGSSTTALAADPNNPDIVYMGKANIGQVFQYNNVWERINSIEITGGVGNVREIEVDSDSKVYVAASNGLWKRDGSDWIKFYSLPNDITALAIDRMISPGIIYVGTSEDGVFVSKDGGNTWIEFNDGLGSLSINVLAISDSEPKIIYAGTARGVWSRKAKPVSVEQFDVVKGIPSEFELKQNFPNPFNATTHIAFSVPKISNIRISIYDVAGRFLWMIYNQKVQAGYNTVVWDASNSPSGVYYIKLTSNEFQEVIKCLLLK